QKTRSTRRPTNSTQSARLWRRIRRFSTRIDRGTRNPLACRDRRRSCSVPGARTNRWGKTVLFIEVKRSAAIIMTVVATWILAAPAPAQQFVMKSGIATRSDIQNEWQNRMKERIEARSGGRLKIEIYVAGQLGSNQVMIDGMQLGTVENFIAPGSFFVGVDPRFQILDVPGVFKDV